MAVASGVDESLNRRDSFCGSFAMQIEMSGGNVVAALQLAQFTPIDPGTDETARGLLPSVFRDGRCWRHRTARCAHCRMNTDATAVIGLEADHIGHRASEFVGICV